MKRKQRSRRTKQTMHLCPDTLHTNHEEGTRCDVRYHPRMGLYDLRDVLMACLPTERKAARVVKEWRKRLKTGDGLLAHVVCDEATACKEVVWHHQEDAPGKPLERQRSRAAVSAGVAFDILTFCDSTMFDARILAMRHLMKEQHGDSCSSQAALAACAHNLVRS